MVNLYKLPNSRARNTNYEQLLRIINDTLQGGSKNLAFIFGGTPDFLTDTRRGLYSYAALRSRLSENTFAAKGLKDYSGPVLRLENLTPADCYTLLRKIRDIYAYGNPKQILLPDKAIKAFINHCSVQIGDAYFRTPRSTVVAFLDLLAVLEQNPHADWRALLDGKEVPGQPENRIPHTHHDKQPPQNTLALAAHASADELVGFVL